MGESVNLRGSDEVLAAGREISGAAEVIRLAVWNCDEILTRNALEFRDLVERLERVQSRAEQLRRNRITVTGTAPRSDEPGIYDAYETIASKRFREGMTGEQIEPYTAVEAPPLTHAGGGPFEERQISPELRRALLDYLTIDRDRPRVQFVRGRGRRQIAFDRITGNRVADLELARAAGNLPRPWWQRLRRRHT